MRAKPSELDQLFYEVGTYQKSKDYFELLDFIVQFKNIAPFNAFLLHVQRPGSKFVATASEWRKKFKRKIRPGARPLVILFPFGPVRFVFDVSDTFDGKPLPEQIENPFASEGELSLFSLSNLIENLKAEGIYYVETKDGSLSAGSIRVSHSSVSNMIRHSGYRYTLKVLFELYVNENLDDPTKFSTILHELGHLFCGHLLNQNASWIPTRTGLQLDQKEFEAESVAWLICKRMGIKVPSARYLSDYRNKDGSIPNIDLYLILKAAGIIEKLLHNDYKIREKLIIDKQKIYPQFR